MRDPLLLNAVRCLSHCARTSGFLASFVSILLFILSISSSRLVSHYIAIRALLSIKEWLDELASY